MSYAGLWEAVSTLRYQPGWSFQLHSGPTFSDGGRVEFSIHHPPVTTAATFQTIPDYQPVYLLITLSTLDSGNGQPVEITHSFGCPPCVGIKGWRRWVLECIFRVHMHEAMEHAEWDGCKPFYPAHGPMADPYAVVEKA